MGTSADRVCDEGMSEGDGMEENNAGRLGFEFGLSFATKLDEEGNEIEVDEDCGVLELPSDNLASEKTFE
jgi:hypothetical protein